MEGKGITGNRPSMSTADQHDRANIPLSIRAQRYHNPGPTLTSQHTAIRDHRPNPKATDEKQETETHLPSVDVAHDGLFSSHRRCVSSICVSVLFSEEQWD